MTAAQRQCDKNIEKILEVYFSDTLPLDVELDILSWIMYGGHQEQKDIKLERLWRDIVRYEERPEDEKKLLESLAALKRHLGLPPVEMKLSVERRPARRIALRVAAVVLPLLMIGGAVIYMGRERNVPPEIPILVASADGLLEVVLPDSSRVWLDKGAKLTYPEIFGDERTLELEGKAYFKVRRDEGRPFVVKTEALAVRVLGTEFTVSAHPAHSEAVVMLASGKIAVDVGGGSHVMDCRATLTYDKEAGSVEHREVTAGESTDWRSMNFEYVGLNAVLEALSERYNIEIERDTAALAGEMVTLRMDGTETLDAALLRLSHITGRFGYTIENDRVIIQIK